MTKCKKQGTRRQRTYTKTTDLYYSHKDIGCTEVAKMYYIDFLLVISMKVRNHGRETRASERKKVYLFVRGK